MAEKIVSSITVGLDKGQNFEISTFDNKMLVWKSDHHGLEVFIYIHDFDKARELRDYLDQMIEIGEATKAPANVEAV